MTTDTRPTTEESNDQPNHIGRRLTTRERVENAIELLMATYTRGVPTAAVRALMARRHGTSERHVDVALDHLERRGDIYQSKDGWKVTFA